MNSKITQEYDYIIIDTPPVLSVTDPLIVSKYADGVLYVVAYNKTKRDDAKAGLAQLEKNNANVLGSVFANIDIKRFKGYHSYDYYNYSSDNGKLH